MAASRSLVNRFRMREMRHALPQSDTSTRTVTNPFIPRQNPETNRWAPPRYSLRRQAELIKRAKLEGNVHLLPPGPKLSLAEILAAKHNKLAQKGTKGKGKAKSEDVAVEWLGEVKERKLPGADIGNRLYSAKKQMFKGHKWERVIRRRRKYQRILMHHMPERIWRWRSQRITRKLNPLSKTYITANSSQKLPF